MYVICVSGMPDARRSRPGSVDCPSAERAGEYTTSTTARLVNTRCSLPFLRLSFSRLSHRENSQYIKLQCIHTSDGNNNAEYIRQQAGKPPPALNKIATLYHLRVCCRMAV
ncbi:uncharacterized protein PGTG_10921 [Puccinia graminis f. sp. tritici CRL 75-36-700-3]|uniref:Uncharacterized protein n=1 Tax=Puccinia graminis f. sp. tritici (strain CRL 75-36-700-3 / race SCCL) TaxID=418459 RepID=E3KKD7_PUCGT|nr:uncharacterized protein PGTG_10921 [Puccinia graminis f. sp. tritici CRL 75-36-700-3]EFP84762.2 hypothetical protein PGTG_10921 [Puccinia graminis f. sp. tritici CRL 75-36-700-3]